MEDDDDDSYTHFTHQVDDFYFSALSTTHEELFPISDEKYAVELQLQEVLMSAALIASRSAPQIIRPAAAVPLLKRSAMSTKERGESSSSSSSSSTAATPLLIFCKICMDTATAAEMFRNGSSCSHSFCRDCLGRYIGAKIQENILVVKCPEVKCKGVLQPELCRDIVPAEVFDRWEAALCESLILGSQRFYCPFKDCSVLMVDEVEGSTVRQAECPNCRRLFCAQCKVGWHAGFSCDEFQRLGGNERAREDLLLMEFAKNKKWKRCPNCRFFVEKTEGCMHITCRCRFEFCYQCGSKWEITHAGCGSN